jgi:nucleoside-diphosphate-sugar epimerase
MILITGCDGYVGFPLTLKVLVNFGLKKVVGVDSFGRRRWVKEVGGESLFPLNKQIKTDRFKFIRGDLSNYRFVRNLFKRYKFDTVIHLASQPSMPYSQIDAKHALYTQRNNVSMCLNLLWAVKEFNPKARFIITTTTGIPGQYYEKIPEEETLNKAGSWYHISRGFDSENCNLASRQWGLNIIEFRTSIVFGSTTEELSRFNYHTRFDTDAYFGTVLNRFIVQRATGSPITVYGEGNQTKPFVSLEDCCHSLMRAIYMSFPRGHTILNQVTEHISIKYLANVISKNVKHIKNPRKENENFGMRFENENFLSYLNRPPQDKSIIINETIHDVEKALKRLGSRTNN